MTTAQTVGTPSFHLTNPRSGPRPPAQRSAAYPRTEVRLRWPRATPLGPLPCSGDGRRGGLRLAKGAKESDAPVANADMFGGGGEVFQGPSLHHPESENDNDP